MPKEKDTQQGVFSFGYESGLHPLSSDSKPDERARWVSAEKTIENRFFKRCRPKQDIAGGRIRPTHNVYATATGTQLRDWKSK